MAKHVALVAVSAPLKWSPYCAVTQYMSQRAHELSEMMCWPFNFSEYNMHMRATTSDWHS